MYLCIKHHVAFMVVLCLYVLLGFNLQSVTVWGNRLLVSVQGLCKRLHKQHYDK